MRNKEPPYVYDRSLLPEILTPSDMASFMRCSEQTVLNRIHAGKLKAHVDGKVIRIRRSDALNYLGLEESA
ncbi:MAG: helix-turn-helix domain-containing protein [Clostridia bacterium]|nr:helix-turn-helix domain-containing protein [Clostridia bacterium]